MGIEANSIPSYDEWFSGSSLFNGIASYGGAGKSSLGNDFDDEEEDVRFRIDLTPFGGGTGFDDSNEEDADDNDDDITPSDRGIDSFGGGFSNRIDLLFPGACIFCPCGIDGAGSL